MSEMNEAVVNNEINEVEDLVNGELSGFTGADGTEILIGAGGGVAIGSVAGYKLGYANGITDVCKAMGLKKDDVIKSIKKMKHPEKKVGFMERTMNKLGYKKIEKETNAEVKTSGEKPETDNHAEEEENEPKSKKAKK